MSARSKPAALVTGSRRGIGRGIALALAKAEFDIVVCDAIEDDAAGETLDLLRGAGAAATFIRHDVTDLAGHPTFAERAWQAFGGIECLVNNAGVQVRRRADILEDTPEDYDRVMGVNLRGPYFLTIEIARRMIADADAQSFHRSIVNVASVNSLLASPMRGPYCVSKAGVSMMTKLFAVRLAPHGIMVNEVRPGVIETDMTANAHGEYDARIKDGLSPVRRWGQPSDVGAAVAAYASGLLPFVTGESIAVDGGLRIPRL